MVEWMKGNVPFIVSMLLMAGGGAVSAARLGDQVALLSNKVVAIERDGTEQTRNLQKKVDGLEIQNNELAQQMREQKEVLNKIDKRVGYLLCRQDKRFCVEQGDRRLQGHQRGFIEGLQQRLRDCLHLCRK